MNLPLRTHGIATRAMLARVIVPHMRPGVETLVQAAKVYGVSVDYLLGLTV